MKFRLVWVGKTRRAALKDLMQDYVERIRRFAPVEITELRDRDDVGSEAKRIVEKEGEEILSRVSDDSYVVALDERGREFDSRGLAALIERHRVGGTKQVTFIIGGPGGLSEAVRERADLVLSLSRLTLTHEMARVLLAEQVYRAFAIIHDLPYQK